MALKSVAREVLRVLLVAAFLFAAGNSCLAQTFRSGFVRTNPETRLDAAAVSARADAWLKSYEAAKDFSGVALIAQGDKILFEKAYGLADPQIGTPNRLDTRFRIASVSKTFTAAAIEKLVADGKLHYSDRLSSYVDGIPNGDTITIEQLLLHESGVGVLDSEDVYRNCLSRQDLLERLAKTKPLFAPGKKSEYSNEGYFLLAAVIERITGGSYADFLGKNIFMPLQMQNSGVACRDLPEGHNAYGSVATASEARLRGLPFNEAALDGPGSVYSNVEDLYRWLRAVNAPTDDGKAVDYPQFLVGKLKYPYGWGKRKYSSRDLIEQSGQLEGFISHVAVYPQEHIYAVMLSNVQSGLSSRIAHDLEAVLFGTGAVSQPLVVTPVVLGVRSMRQYIGGYHSPETPYPQTLEIRDGELAMHWGSDPFWREMVMIDGDTFFLRAEYARIHFTRGADGLIHGMTWSWPGGSQLSFEKDHVTGGPEPSVPPNPQ
jgi:CubicO group peptidase (beta-lactamase class C family)